MNRFDEVLGRLKACLNVWRDQDVARYLCFSASAFSERKRRNSFPEKELIALAQRRPELAIDVNYVLTGRPYPAAIDGERVGANRALIARYMGKSLGAVSYHRRVARRLGLLSAH